VYGARQRYVTTCTLLVVCTKVSDMCCVHVLYQNTKVFSYFRKYLRTFESTKVRKYESIYEGTYLFRAIVCMYLEVRNNILSHEYLSYDTKV